MNEIRQLCVAAVQIQSDDGGIEYNLARAEPYVAEAKRKGAMLVLLPELLPTGFEINAAMWSAAEPAQGSTVRWLKETAVRHGVWIGTSFLEAVGTHFYNAFVLVDPAGMEAMRVRKGRPAATEAFVYEGYENLRVADTAIGRIGVSICYEGFLASTMRALHGQGADLVLLPMSAPTPTLNPPLSDKDLEEYNGAIKILAPAVAGELGVPVILANKVGPWNTKSPWPFPKEDSRFPGMSTIAEGDGRVLGRLRDQEGVLVETITLDPSLKAARPAAGHGKWARKPPRLFRLFVISETLGWLRYHMSIRRRRAARRVSAQTT